MTGRLCCENKSVQDLKRKHFDFFLWPRNLLAAFAGCFRWASCGNWKIWALDRATLLITKSGAGGRDCVFGQDRPLKVTQSARYLLRESAGTLSQWLSESKSYCQTQSTRAAGWLVCQLQVDNWWVSGDLAVFPIRLSSSCQCRRQLGSERAAAFNLDGPQWLSESEFDCQITRATGWRHYLGEICCQSTRAACRRHYLGDICCYLLHDHHLPSPPWKQVPCNTIHHNICC